MAAKAHGQVAGVLAAYDFSVFDTIGDIGGGRGHLLRAILDAVPTVRAVLFDLPRVIDEARPLASTERLRLQPGDFFKDALPACDGYVVMEVIHAFGDADVRPPSCRTVYSTQIAKLLRPSQSRLKPTKR
jgi:hypothetical protein